jgi:hypothetical protein
MDYAQKYLLFRVIIIYIRGRIDIAGLGILQMSVSFFSIGDIKNESE